MTTIDNQATATMKKLTPPPAQPPVPADPRLKWGDRALLRLVWKSVRAVSAHVPPLRIRLPGGPDPRQLLALLTFCYSTGIYATEDIEYAARQGRLPPGLVPRSGLTADLLRAFRRANRPWIEESLARVFARLPEAAAWFTTAAENALPPERHLEACRRAARRAVELATLFDTALAD
jgi:hypothetical protein